MQYATENIIPVTLELGGKSCFSMKSVGDADAFFDKAVEGAVLFALNQRICTAPSRLLVHDYL
jgi:aldehyde dehydrogenase